MICLSRPNWQFQIASFPQIPAQEGPDLAPGPALLRGLFVVLKHIKRELQAFLGTRLPNSLALPRVVVGTPSVSQGGCDWSPRVLVTARWPGWYQVPLNGARLHLPGFGEAVTHLQCPAPGTRQRPREWPGLFDLQL